NWFATPGMEPRYEYTYGRQNWFEASAGEHRAVREAVGLFDQSSFGKTLISGPDAERVLNRICANDIAVEPGRVVYTQWLNDRGGIEGDVTVTRLDETRYMVVSAAADQMRDLEWAERQIPGDARCVATDVTASWAVLNVQGPASRELISRISPADLSNEAFPYMTSQEIEVGLGVARAFRVTYMGELGYELHVPTDQVQHVYDELMAASEGLGLRHAGYHALNSLRIEKAYRFWGYDIGDEDTPLEAGLGFAVAWDKPGGFIGREALLRLRETGLQRRLVVFSVDDPEPLVYGNEPIWRDGVLVGRTASGWYGHTLGRSIALGYVDSGAPGAATSEWLLGGRYELELANERFAVTPSLRPLYDPKGERVRA
ncbi:MAG TPA: aminomethyltransferase family protein, partial [Candidatus Limnocylindrales bacterium]|nr:aminomethyltransferase family protein [Candidatus Limnocylindrales bacterium]